MSRIACKGAYLAVAPPTGLPAHALRGPVRDVGALQLLFHLLDRRVLLLELKILQAQKESRLFLLRLELVVRLLLLRHQAQVGHFHVLGCLGSLHGRALPLEGRALPFEGQLRLGLPHVRLKLDVEERAARHQHVRFILRFSAVLFGALFRGGKQHRRGSPQTIAEKALE